MSLAKSRGLSLAPLCLVVGVAAIVLSLSGSAFTGSSSGAFRPAAEPVPSAPAGPTAAPLDPPASLPAVIATVPVGQEPLSTAYDPANGYVYVANSISDNVSVLAGTGVVASVDLSPNQTGDPLFVTYDDVNGYVYVVDATDFETGTGAVSILEGTSVVGVIPIGMSPVFAAVDEATGDLYVVNSGSNDVSVIDGTGLVALSVPVGTDPSWAVYSAFLGEVFVTNAGSANVSVLYGTTVAGAIPVGQDPTSAAFDPDASSEQVLVANGGSNNVSVLSLEEVAANVPVGAGPQYVGYTPSIQGLDVANTNSSNVSVLELVGGTTWTVVANLAVAAGPTTLGPGPNGVYTFVAGTVGNAVSVLNGTSYVGNVSVGSAPRALSADPANGYEYVANSGSNSVSILATAYPVTFNETGLALGTSWSVDLAGTSGASTTSSIGFLEPNGTYAYTVPAPTGYRLVNATPSSPIQVQAAGVLVNVTFAALPATNYTLTFNETGLTCSGGNGSDSYGGGSGGHGGRDHHGGQGGQGGQNESCCSSMDQGDRALGDATMGGYGGMGNGCCGSSSTSLPVWNVTIGDVTKSTNGTTIVFSLPDGTYSYTIGPPSGYNVSSSPASPVTIEGANLTVAVTFSQVAPPAIYSITFVEQGLPNGTSWCVSANNSTECTNGSSVVFTGLAPGTYGYSVGQVSGYSAQPSSGRVTIRDANVTVAVKFSASGHHHCM